MSPVKDFFLGAVQLIARLRPANVFFHKPKHGSLYVTSVYECRTFVHEGIYEDCFDVHARCGSVDHA